MSDSLPPTLTPDTGRRKLVAIAVAVVCVLIMAFAFLSGGKKTTVTKDNETDTPVGTLQDGPDLLAGGTTTPEDWFLNAPNGGVVAQTGTEQPATDAESKKTSSVVTGDDPAANPPAGGPAASTGTAAANTMSGQNGTSGSAKAAGTTGVVVAADLGSKSSDAPTRVGADNSSTTAPQAGSGAVAASKSSPSTKSTQSATSVVADNASTSSPKAESGGTVASKPNPAANGLPEAITTGNTGRVASSNKADASTVSATPSSSAAPKDDMPEFVRPVAKRPGLIAQSRALVTERQFKRARASEPEPKASGDAKSSTPAPAPVVVPKVEAEDYARRTTETLRQQGTLKPTQSVRLPRQQETANTRVWREDDTPATAEERRPFGLVVEDTNPAFTPEGIPLRTDIPSGVSPLEKTGADKPLWKKPQ